jgi:hypothetical protein
MRDQEVIDAATTRHFHGLLHGKAFPALSSQFDVLIWLGAAFDQGLASV